MYIFGLDVVVVHEEDAGARLVLGLLLLMQGDKVSRVGGQEAYPRWAASCKWSESCQPFVPALRGVITPTGKPPPLAVRLAKALPFQRAQGEMSDALAAHDALHTADSAHACARITVGSGHTTRQGRRYDTSATAAGGVQGLQAISPRHWPPLGAFIKLPTLWVVHDWASTRWK